MPLPHGSLHRGPLELSWALVPKNQVPVDQTAVTQACQTCPHYERNWACPPHAPNFADLAGNHLLVIHLRLHVPNPELRPQHERMVGEMATHTVRILAQHLQAIPLGWGQCTACPTCTCPQQPCPHPQQRLHSLEATGVLVTELVQMCFQRHLQWWNQSPTHASRVIAVSHEKPLDLAEIMLWLEESL